MNWFSLLLGIGSLAGPFFPLPAMFVACLSINFAYIRVHLTRELDGITFVAVLLAILGFTLAAGFGILNFGDIKGSLNEILQSIGLDIVKPS